MNIVITNYTFDKTAKTITFTDYTTIVLERIKLIINVTSNTLIYQFNKSGYGGTVATNVLTLAFDTSAMVNTDKLLIEYDDANYDVNAVVEKTGSGSSNNTDLINFDAKNYKFVSIQLTGFGVATVSFQVCNNNIDWQSTILFDTAGSASTGITGTALNKIYFGAINARYFRARITAYTSGTIAATAEFSSIPPPQSQAIVGITNPTSIASVQYLEDNVSAADPTGNMLMAVRRDTLSTAEVNADGDNIALKATNKGQLHIYSTDLGAAAALADAMANPTVVSMGGMLFGWNGTTWDRLLAVGDNADALATATKGHLQTLAHNLVFNGTTWDRVRGDITNGLDVDVTRQPARVRTADSIATADQTDAVMAGAAALTPKFAIITASASGNTSVVALVATKKIRVLSCSFMANGTVNVKFQSNTTDKTGLSYLIANTGKVLPYNKVGWFETAAGEALNINLSAAIAVGGELTYIEV